MNARCIVLLLSPLLCLSAAAQPRPACDRPVLFSAAWFEDPEVDHGKSIAQITALAGAPGGPGKQLGHVVVETRLAVQPQTACTGFRVRLEYIKPVLRVAKEFPADSCAYARVMNHERTHVRIHRDIARAFSELSYPWAAGASPAAILAYAKLELDRLMQAQVLFDSPEEYARNHTACGGEIARLVQPVAAAKPAGK